MKREMSGWGRCSDCGLPCKAREESFDYAGTHCTNGKVGTHYTGYYVSDCCGADVIEQEETMSEDQR